MNAFRIVYNVFFFSFARANKDNNPKLFNMKMRCYLPAADRTSNSDLMRLSSFMPFFHINLFLLFSLAFFVFSK